MKVIKRFILFTVTAVGILAAGVYLAHYVEDAQLIRQGNQIVEKIEKFRTIYGRLPSNLTDAGIPDNGPIYYDKRNETEYVVWYGKRLGESEMYNSKEKEWALRD